MSGKKRTPKSHSKTSWIIIFLFLLLAYPISFGPAYWMVGRGILSLHTVAQAYKPLVYAAESDPTGLLVRWAELGAPDQGLISWMLLDLKWKDATKSKGNHL